MKGIYKTGNGKYGARISRKGSTVYLGSYDAEYVAATMHDVACLIFGKPISSYNYPSRQVTIGELQKVLFLLKGKDLITDEDIIQIIARYNVITEVAEKLKSIHVNQTDNT